MRGRLGDDMWGKLMTWKMIGRKFESADEEE